MPDRKELERYLELLEYELALKEAEDDLLRFSELIMPDPRKPSDPRASRYHVARHTTYMGHVMMEIERGERKKVIINTAPRHGKSQLCTKNMTAWFSARNPEKDIIVATYNEKFAGDFAREVRDIMASPRFRQVFPEYYLKAESSERLVTYMGGNIFFLGRRSSTTGRGADLILVDDPTKDDKEIRYPAFRDDCWQWFTQTLLTRRHTDKAAICISQCMTGDTPVMMEDGAERPLRDVRPGDRIATYDGGRLGSSVILGFKNCGPDDTFKIRMTSGATVRANERHPFLVVRGGRTEWIRLRNIRPGDAIVRVAGASGRASHASGTGATSPFGLGDFVTRTTTSGAGKPDTARRPRRKTASPGSLASSSIAMASRLMTMSGCCLSKAAAALSAFASPPRLATLTTGPMCSALTTATTLERSGGFSATTATLQSAGESQPKPLSEWRHMSDFTLDIVQEITPDAREDVFDIMVERTENFIANGLVSHNTRWHEDDIVGRISDPSNPSYSSRFAEGFEIINLPAIANDGDPLFREIGEPLWPERFGLAYLEEMRDANPTSFAALYQCDPTPDDGVFFRNEEIFEYELHELPERLQLYTVSDHAVSTASMNDATCMVTFGVDDNGTAWIMPEIVWKKLDAQSAVEEMINIIKLHNPIFWYAERGHITRAIGPFLEKRMMEESVYCPIIEDHPVGDKVQRAQSGRARCAQGKIRFPKWVPWWARAKSEMLKFPNGRFDDFVDCVSMIGMKMNTHSGPGSVIAKKEFAPGTFGHMLKQFREEDMLNSARKARAGW